MLDIDSRTEGGSKRFLGCFAVYPVPGCHAGGQACIYTMRPRVSHHIFPCVSSVCRTT